MFNKKRLFVFVVFLLIMFFMMTFAGSPTQTPAIATRTVTFTDGFDNSLIDEQVVEVGTDAKVPEAPTHKNYVFGGWYLYENRKQRVTDFSNIMKDLHVVALYGNDRNNNGIDDENDTYYTVTFIDSIDNSVIDTESVLVGMDATAPTAPRHDGYTFSRWNGNYRNVTSNRTVRAMYNRNSSNTPVTTNSYELNIDYLYENGKTASASYKASVNQGDNYSVTSPSIKGYNPDKKVVSGTMGDANISEKVTYEASHHKVSYDTDGGSECPDTVVVYDSTYGTLCKPEKEGHTFDHWEDEDGNEVTEDTPVTKTDDEELIAKYEVNSYDLTVHYVYSKDNSKAADDANQTVEYNTTYSVTSPEIEKYHPEPATVTGTMPAHAVEETVVYKPNNDENNNDIPDEDEYRTITYKDGENGAVFEDKVFTKQLDGLATPTYTAPANKPGYSFGEWNPEVAAVINGDATYTATWVANRNTPYTVEHYFKGVGVNAAYVLDESKTQHLEGETDTQAEATPLTDVEGFTFDSENTNNVLKGNIAGDGSLVLKVYYTRTTSTITVDPQDPDCDAEATTCEPTTNTTLEYGDNATLPYVAREYKLQYNVGENPTPVANVTLSGDIDYYCPGTTDTCTEGKIVLNGSDKTVEVGTTDDKYTAHWSGNFTTTIAEGTGYNTTTTDYTFAGWSLTENGPKAYGAGDSITLSKDTVLYALYTSAPHQYEVTFVDEDGTVLKAATKYDYGTAANAIVKPADPTKAADAQYTYTFAGWTPEIADVTADATYTARYTSSTNSYTITWVDGNGATLKTDTVAYGATPEYKGDTPTKQATAQYTYTFNNTWSPEIVPVVGDATYTAQFSSTTNKYIVTWVDGDGKTLKTDTVAYGETPEYNGTTPTKTATAEFTYTFNNTWNPTVVAVTGNATYTAQFSSTTNNYTVTFVDEDGTVLKAATEYPYGTAANDIVKPADPTKTADAQYTYTFAGWTPEIAEVTANATYTATYRSSTNSYTITWVDGDGNTLTTDTVVYGETPEYNGTTPTKTATAEFTYTFNQTWSPAIVPVTADATYTAQFDATTNEYKVTWVDGNGDTLKTDTVAYGETPAYTGDTPTKQATAQYTYTFNQTWSPAIVPVTEDATYTAQFDATTNEYKVTWVDGNGDTLKTDTVAYGQTPSYSGTTPTKTSANGYTYTFNNTWNPTVVAVTGNATYTAQFDSAAITYNITYNGIDGATVSPANPTTYTVDQTPISLSNPTKTGYTFTGWTGTDLTAATKDVVIAQGSTGDRTYTANWEIKKYKVTYKYVTTGEGAVAVPDNAPAVPAEQEYEYNATVPAAAVPSLPGYVFEGWTGEVTTMPDNDVEVTGYWRVRNQSFTIDANKTVQMEGDKLAFGDTITFTVTITNNGDDASDPVTLVDELLANSPLSGENITISPSTVTGSGSILDENGYTIDSVPAHSTVTLTIVVTVGGEDAVAGSEVQSQSEVYVNKDTSKEELVWEDSSVWSHTVETEIKFVERTPNTQGYNVIVLIDESGSMGYQTNANEYVTDGNGNPVPSDKFANAKAATKAFIDMMYPTNTDNTNNSKLAVYRFGSTVNWCIMGICDIDKYAEQVGNTIGSRNDAYKNNGLIAKINELGDHPYESGTPYKTAFTAARNALFGGASGNGGLSKSNPNNKNIIIFLTDGAPDSDDNNGGGRTTILKSIKNLGGIIYSIGFDVTDSEMTLLNTISNDTNGKAYKCPNDVNQLKQIFAFIKEDFDNPEDKWTEKGVSEMAPQIQVDANHPIEIYVGGEKIKSYTSDPTNDNTIPVNERYIIKENGKYEVDASLFPAGSQIKVVYYVPGTGNRSASAANLKLGNLSVSAETDALNPELGIKSFANFDEGSDSTDLTEDDLDEVSEPISEPKSGEIDKEANETTLTEEVLEVQVTNETTVSAKEDATVVAPSESNETVTDKIEPTEGEIIPEEKETPIVEEPKEENKEEEKTVEETKSAVVEETPVVKEEVQEESKPVVKKEEVSVELKKEENEVEELSEDNE